MKNYIQDFEVYLRQKKKAAENTIVSYTRDILKFVDFIHQEGRRDITSCSDKDVSKFIEVLNRQGMSCSTITRTLASLRAFYAYLVSAKVIKKNPTRNVKTEKKKKALPRVLTNKEVDLFLSQPKCDTLKGFRDKAMLELLYATGIRVSELIALNLKDVNCELGFVRCGEDSNERVIPLYPAAIAAVSGYLNSARPMLIANQYEKALFVNLNGERMTRQGFWKIIKHYQNTAKITTDITPHVLRHSFAAHLIQNGADIDVVKEIMGHSDISSTMVYAQLIKNNLKNTYIKFHPRA